jgi:hypothetical protein
MNGYQINPKKAGEAVKAFAHAARPRQPAQGGRKGRKDGRALHFVQDAAAVAVKAAQGMKAGR